jgi:peptidoglycan/xylan/chitin deacetylase (PgdA/CDA1 family)
MKREEVSDTNPSLVSAIQNDFDAQMKHLAEHYSVVGLAQVLDAVSGGPWLPNRAVLITFDDAYADFSENAWPILSRYRLPVTLFVPTAYPDHEERVFWWDRLYDAFLDTSLPAVNHVRLGVIALRTRAHKMNSFREVKRKLKAMRHQEAMMLVDELCRSLGETSFPRSKVLSWDALRALAKRGVTMASHTRTHALLNRLSPPEIREELNGSQDDLRREIGYALPVLCYPGGHYDRSVLEIVKQEGIRVAFATRDGHNDLAAGDLLCLKRTNITLRTSLPIFRLRLLHIATILDSWRHQEQHRAALQ